MFTYTNKAGVIVEVAEEFTVEDDEQVMLADACESDVEPLRKLFADSHTAEQIALDAATAEQKGIGYGAFVARDWTDDEHGTFTVWGHIEPLSVLEFAERMRGAADDEVDRLLHRIVLGYLRGWRYGQWWSAPYPDGDYGAAHVVNLRPVTASEFDAARWRNWKGTQ